MQYAPTGSLGVFSMSLVLVLLRFFQKRFEYLAALDTAATIKDMDIPGFRFHPLKGERKGSWSITVSGNWRVTFEFRDGNAYIINYEDYH